MRIETDDLTAIKGSFRLCAWELLIALTALFLALYVVHPDLHGLDITLFQTDSPKIFLTIVALPSMLLGIILTYAAHIQGLTLHVAKTVLSMFLSYILYLALKEWHRPKLLGDFELALGLVIFAVLHIFYEIVRRSRAQHREGGKVLLVGNGALARQMADLMDNSADRFKLVGQVEYPNPQTEKAGLDPREILALAKQLQANQILISLKERRGVFPLKAMLACKLSGIEVLDAPGLYERMTGKLLIENITPSWFIFCHGFKVTRFLRACKRLMDITLALTGMVLFAPFGLFVALAIKLDSPGPIFFRQIRVGQGDNQFKLVKFRSMRQDAEKKSGAVWAKKNDARVTRLGYFLRKFRIDEIPQLYNVLKGEMSLVGPRPERPEFVETLKTHIPYYSERHYVKPGVTGWAQVCYPYGASVNDAIEKLRYDMYYIKNISLFFDLRIICRTISVILFCKGSR
jgi:sugar transferase (PEP-CTERM system associated)